MYNSIIFCYSCSLIISFFRPPFFAPGLDRMIHLFSSKTLFMTESPKDILS
nr:MAG TPA: hypothetical protein [Caudoviricetes sp.]